MTGNGVVLVGIKILYIQCVNVDLIRQIVISDNLKELA
jgi:hypothetical protein